MTAKQIRENWESFGPKPAWVRRSNDILHPERSKARVLPDIQRPSYKGILLPRDPEPLKDAKVSFSIGETHFRLSNGMLVTKGFAGTFENRGAGNVPNRTERRKMEAYLRASRRANSTTGLPFDNTRPGREWKRRLEHSLRTL